jgi:hypothetical protein
MGGDRTTARPNAVAGRNPATPTNLPVGYSARAGVIGMADTLGRTGGTRTAAEHFSFGPISAVDMPTSNLTMSMWIKPSNPLAVYAHAMTLAGSGTDKQNNIYLGKIDWRGATALSFYAVATGNGDELGVTAPAWTPNSWQLVHAVLDGGIRRIYNNGVEAGASAAQTLPAIMDRPNALIGATLWPDSSFQGVYDEVRVANVSRPASWAKLEYETQKIGATALTVGATSVPGAPLANLHFGNDTIRGVTGTAFTRTATFANGPVDSFKVVSGSLPAGLALGKTTGIVSGTPTAVTAVSNVTVRAWAGADSASVVLAVSVVQGVETLRYITGNAANRDTLRFTVGTARTVTPTFTGTATKFSISGGALPAGLAFDTLTGVLSGTATAVSAGNRTVTLTGPNNSTTRDIRIDIIAAFPTVRYSPGDTLTATAGASFTAAPVVDGRAVTKWAAVTALPAGLRLDTLNGAISGTPTASAGAADYTIRGMNATDTVNKAIRLTVTAASTDGVYATAWSGHRSIKLNTSATGANVAGTVTNVPVLVRFDATHAAVFTGAGANGASLRFTKANGTTRLPHEIDHWDAGAQKGAVWVLVDSVRGNNSSQEILLHFGNSSATSLSNAHAVFSESNGFVSAFHMGGNNVAPRANAVVGRNPAYPANLPSNYTARTGVIGAADSLAGGATAAAGQHFSFGPLPVGTFPTGNVTLSLWLKQNVGVSDWRHIISLGSGAPNQNIWIGTPGDAGGAGALRLRTAEGTAERTAVNMPGAASPGNWLLLHASIAGPAATIYANGVSIGSGDIAHTIADVARTTAYIARSLWPDSTFAGVFDEVRIANAARSADWAKLEYENQKPTQTLVKVDTIPTSLASALTQGSALSFQAAGQGILFQARTAKAAQLKLSLIDIHGRTVWTQTARTEVGVNRIAWNGLSSSGRPVPSGIYTVRMALVDAQGKAVAELNRSLPLTR